LEQFLKPTLFLKKIFFFEGKLFDFLACVAPAAVQKIEKVFPQKRKICFQEKDRFQKLFQKEENLFFRTQIFS
jgi:hypothetical protein